MTLFTLCQRERRMLEWFITQTVSAQQLCRAYALLWLDDGETVQEVAERLSTTRQTVYNWVIRFQARSNLDIFARLSDGERSGRPRTAHGIIDPLIDKVIDCDPRKFGYNSTGWTASLLQQYLEKVHRISVSRKSISFAIDRLGIAWKLPRYVLSRQDPFWRQAKGGLKRASGRMIAPLY